MFLKTKRLLLRPLVPEDARAVFTGLSDHEIVRNLSSAPWPYTVDAAVGLASSAFRPLQPRFAIVEADTTSFSGVIGLDEMPDGTQEIGFWITRSMWNKGYATESCKAVLNYADEVITLSCVYAAHFKDNPASGNVLRKLGFSMIGEVKRFSCGRKASHLCDIYRLSI